MINHHPLSRKRARALAREHIAQIKEKYQFSRTLIFFYLRSERIEPPKTLNDESFLLRVLCDDWWTRKLLNRDRREREAIQIARGNVARGRQIYCSDQTLNEVKARAAVAVEMMSGKMLVSDHGDELDMLEVMKSSLANPSNKRAEFMVRVAGFEQYADQRGDVGIFCTITCPSSYHRFSGSTLNENYNHTPREGQAYLTRLWAQIRAQFKRDGLLPYGFRVAEPHADGTPHWHMLLFMPADQVERCVEIMKEYALREDGDEEGADEHRFTAKRILKEIVTKDGVKRVSATGYIAKYVSKNIGFDVGPDHEDLAQNTETTGERVKAWSATWGIRQFQQIGGAGVGVWRELRRLKDSEIEDDAIKQARDCCVSNDWAGFLELMGGVNIARMEREIKLLRNKVIDTKTGEFVKNKYKEVVEKIIGISARTVEVITRLKKWTVVDKQIINGKHMRDVLRANSAFSSPWTSINNCTA